MYPLKHVVQTTLCKRKAKTAKIERGSDKITVTTGAPSKIFFISKKV